MKLRSRQGPIIRPFPDKPVVFCPDLIKGPAIMHEHHDHFRHQSSQNGFAGFVPFQMAPI